MLPSSGKYTGICVVRVIVGVWHPLNEDKICMKRNCLLFISLCYPSLFTGDWSSEIVSCSLCEWKIWRSKFSSNALRVWLLTELLRQSFSKNAMKNACSLYQDVSPSTSLALSCSSAAAVTRTVTKTLPLKQKMDFVNLKTQHLQNINKQSKSVKDLEVQLLQVECEELKSQLGCLRVGRSPVPFSISNCADKQLLWKEFIHRGVKSKQNKQTGLFLLSFHPNILLLLNIVQFASESTGLASS